MSRYTLGEPLGRGGVGEVIAAHDTLLDRDVALKLLPADARPKDVERFRREGRLHAALSHPNIVPVYDAGDLPDGRPYLAMKRIRGRSVGALLEEGELSRQDRMHVFCRVAEAVGHAHAKGIVHRDLKPDNVMVGDHGEVLLVDWGLARGPDGRARERKAGEGTRLTRVGQILGTPYYMAPELAQGRGRDAGPAADVFSLGALLYTLISDQPPYDSVDLYEVVTRVATGEVRPLRAVAPDVHPQLAAIVARAMALEPDARFATAADLLSAVRRHLEPSPASRRTARLVTLLAGLTAIVLLGVAAGGLVLASWVLLIAPG
jgi:serine/threonine-protein kinase